MKFTPPPVLVYFNIVKDIWLSTYSRRTVSISRGTRERNRNTPLDAPDSGKADFSTVFAFLWGNNLSESKHNGVVIYTAKRRNYSFSCFSKHLSHNV